MRDGLKKRIKGTNPTNTLSFVKKDYIGKNVFNKRIASNKCSTNGNCSNLRDADGFWVGKDQEGQRQTRQYYAPFRQPLRGWRKNLDCTASNSNNRCWKVTEIYKDSWTNCINDNCLTKGSLSNTKLSTGNQNRASSGILTKSSRPLIRSGMQPNTAGQQNSGMNSSKKQYSYSYHELIKNRRKDTYIKKLPTQEPTGTDKTTTGFGGNCNSIDNCSSGYGENIYRLNNKKFKTQGAVDSSSRIDRLKYDTIKGQSRCSSGQSGPKEDRSDCNGVYFAGKPRATFGPANNSEYLQRKYVSLFNNTHTEVNYPQTSALARVRGAVSHKTTINPNGGICCNDKPPQFLM